MKKLLFISLACMLSLVSFSQKKNADKKNAATTVDAVEMDSMLKTIYSSYDTERQILENQMAQTTDTLFLKAISFQRNNLETKCANRMWGYLISQTPSVEVLKRMFNMRTAVDKEIVEKSMDLIKDKKLTQESVYIALHDFVSKKQAEVGEKFAEIELAAPDSETPALKLSDEIKTKSVMLILGDLVEGSLPKTFDVFFKKLDTSSVEFIQVKFISAADMLSQDDDTDSKKAQWRVYNDVRGPMSPVVLDYNVVTTPLCVLIEKGTGKITMTTNAITDEIMSTMLVM